MKRIKIGPFPILIHCRLALDHDQKNVDLLLVIFFPS